MTIGQGGKLLKGYLSGLSFDRTSPPDNVETNLENGVKIRLTINGKRFKAQLSQNGQMIYTHSGFTSAIGLA